MKKFTLKWLTPLLLLVGITAAKAQLQLQVTGGPQFYSRVSKANGKIGFGLFVNPHWCLGDGDLSAGALIGYTHFSTTEEYMSQDINLMPLMGTIKYRFFETGFRPLGGISSGVAFLKGKQRLYFPDRVENYSKALFCYNAFVGFECDIISERLGISLDANYTSALGKAAAVDYTGINLGVYYIFE